MVDLATDLAAPPSSPTPAAETAFGMDWDVSDGGPNESGSAIAPLAVHAQEFDVTALPSNAVAIIRFAWVAFKVSGPGGVDTANYGVIVALRDDTGALTCTVSNWASVSASLGAAVLAGVTDINTPDADTVRLEVTNLNHDTQISIRWAISFVSTSSPVNPP